MRAYYVLRNLDQRKKFVEFAFYYYFYFVLIITTIVIFVSYLFGSINRLGYAKAETATAIIMPSYRFFRVLPTIIINYF